MSLINRTSLSFSTNLKRVILQYLSLPGNDRIKNIYDRVMSLSEQEAIHLLRQVQVLFGKRHRKLEEVFLKNYHKSRNTLGVHLEISTERALLIGSFFTKEYSTQSAALFNPSMVLHPSQSGVAAGDIRFIMSLRATGEGHISSIEFRTGIISENGEITMDIETGFSTCSEKDLSKKYLRDFIIERLDTYKEVNPSILSFFPAEFTAKEGEQILETLHEQNNIEATKLAFLEILDTNYAIITQEHEDFSEKVIFPNAKGECMGMEDVRFVKFFGEDGFTKYYGTYTAYDGKTIKTQMIETFDFINFEVRTLYGLAIKDKGMALFPEKIEGKYVMITRQGGEIINIMFSDSLYFWDKYEPLLTPKYDWEFVQMGNCGSPIKTEKGWLLLTHAVGIMRRYVISAALLDLQDPTKVLARLDKPILEPLENEREGYVPNVVYTCGWLLHGDKIIIPFAMSDTACGMSWISKTALLNELLAKV